MSDLQIRSTGTTEVIQSSDGRITLSVPIQIKRRSGRKQMTLPNGQSGQPGKLLRPWDVWRPHRCNWRWQGATAGWPCWSPAR